MHSLGIKSISLAATLVACCALARGEDLAPALRVPNSSAKIDLKITGDERLARAPEPIPLPPIANPIDDDQLTLAEAESMATSFHPAIREAVARVRAAHGNWVQVGLKPNPEAGYAANEIGDEGKAGQQGGIISQEIVTGGKLELNRAVALREQAQAEQRLEQVRAQVITTVRKYYFECLAAERAVIMARQLNQIAAESVDVSEQRLKAMNVPKTSLLQSQIESDSAALVEQQASERHAAARRRLATSIGSQDQLPPRLEDVFIRPLPELDYATVRERLMQDSPELAELRFAVDRARWAVQRASAGRVPNVNTQAGVQFDNATQYTIANVQVTLPIPIHDRNQGAIAEACGQLAAAQAALEARELAIQQRLTTALRDYTTARERVAKYTDKILPAAKESLDLINFGYQQGKLDYTQVYNVQQTYAAKSLSYLQDLETAWQEWAEIDGFLVGELPASAIDRTSQTPENTEGRRF